MRALYRLEGSIQNYDWGSRQAIAELLGQEVPSREPQAELWFGAHKQAPSTVETEEGPQPLDLFLDGNPALLGRAGSDREGGELPFLLKILAARKPLSIQVHPDADQAREGFSREEQTGVPRSSPNRSYRDSNAKPEVLCALTRFSALQGFRPIDEVVRSFGCLLGPAMKERLEAALTASALEPHEAFLTFLLGLPESDRQPLLAAIAGADAESAEGDLRWVGRLSRHFPGDIGVLAPLFLNCVELDPGQGLATPAGILHSYLGGTAVELMRASDNVVRAGLTGKSIDVDELLRLTRFEATVPRLLAPEPVSGGGVARSEFRSEDGSLLLERFELEAGRRHTRSPQRAVEIVLCTRGLLVLEARRHTGTKDTLEISRGEAALITAATEWYTFATQDATAEAFVASAPVGRVRRR